MRSFLFATVAVAALTTAAIAQESPVTAPAAPAADAATEVTGSTNKNMDAGVAVGGVTGAATGALIGGPVGAVIGGFAGAMIGSATAVPQPAVDYVVAHPVDPVPVGQPVAEGYVMPADAALAPIPDYPDYSYVYVDGRPVIVRASSREVVYSPGYVVPDTTVAYVEGNPLDPVVIQGGVSVGAVVPADVQLVEIPSDPAYAYVYTDTGPVLVNRSSRTVVWVRG
jgi:hypothetical protein